MGAGYEFWDQSVQAFRHGATRRAAQAMLRDGGPWKGFMKHPDWEAIRALEAGYKSVQTPCLIAWGDCNETLSLAMGYELKDHSPTRAWS